MIEPVMERIVLGLMPPPDYNMVANEDQLDLLARWIDGGMQP
jgi:hypothetical protein